MYIFGSCPTSGQSTCYLWSVTYIWKSQLWIFLFSNFNRYCEIHHITALLFDCRKREQNAMTLIALTECSFCAIIPVIGINSNWETLSRQPSQNFPSATSPMKHTLGSSSKPTMRTTFLTTIWYANIDNLFHIYLNEPGIRQNLMDRSLLLDPPSRFFNLILAFPLHNWILKPLHNV